MTGAIALTSSPGMAWGQDKAACAAAYERAQTERRQGHLRVSREQLLVCSQPACSVLQRECVTWLSEVEAALPSVVLEATGPDGHDAVDVQVTCDGAPLVSRLDGKGVPMDPGLHACRFAMGGAERAEQIVLHEGERDRPWRISFALPRAAGPEAPPARASIPAWAWILGGAGVAAIGVGTYFELHGFAQKSDLDRCRGSCQQSAVDATHASFLTGDVTIGVGLAAVAVAAVAVLAGSRTATGTTSAGLEVLPWASGAQLRGRF